MHIINA